MFLVLGTDGVFLKHSGLERGSRKNSGVNLLLHDRRGYNLRHQGRKSRSRNSHAGKTPRIPSPRTDPYALRVRSSSRYRCARPSIHIENENLKFGYEIATLWLNTPSIASCGHDPSWNATQEKGKARANASVSHHERRRRRRTAEHAPVADGT